MMLVLTGSAIGAMNELTDRPGAPLAGRFDDRISVEPLDLPAAALILDRLPPDAVISAYAACGGYPLHLRAWDQSASHEDNLRRLAFSPGGILLEAGRTLELDLPGVGRYARLLHAIGAGTAAFGQMARVVGQRIERPLDHLLATGYVRGARPVGAADRSPRRYEVPDAFLRFWLELLWPEAEQIEGGRGEAVLSAPHAAMAAPPRMGLRGRGASPRRAAGRLGRPGGRPDDRRVVAGPARAGAARRGRRPRPGHRHGRRGQVVGNARDRPGRGPLPPSGGRGRRRHRRPRPAVVVANCTPGVGRDRRVHAR